MDKIYYNPRHPASFGGINKLYHATKGKNTQRDVRQWLSKQDAYTLHKPVRHRFRRSRYIHLAIDETWQSDLADLSSLQLENDGTKFLLVVIDIFSKFLWVEPLRSKESTEVLSAFERIFARTERRPKNLNTDQGKEFVNKKLEGFLSRNGIRFYTAHNVETKASYAERVIRTLKSKLFRYMTAKNTHKYIDVLQDIVFSYNHSKHRTINEKPADVTIHNESTVRERLNKSKHLAAGTSRNILVGDAVRIVKEKTTFRKGYQHQWTKEIFFVSRIISSSPQRYALKDFNNEEILGTFYAEEIQKVAKKETFEVSKIIKRRTFRNKRQCLVTWQGYPDDMASWVDCDTIETI